jgi:AcrR family transcriptional regulator
MCKNPTDTREKILRAAGLLFAESGFTTTSMDDVAKAVGVKKATLYHYFESKEELLKEILSLLNEKLSQELQAAAQNSQDSLTALREIINRLIVTSDTCPEIHIFSMLAISDSDRREVTKFVLDMKRNLFAQLKALIFQLDPCQDQSQQTATLISFTILGMVINSHVTADTTEAKSLVDHFIKIIQHGRDCNLVGDHK